MDKTFFYLRPRKDHYHHYLGVVENRNVDIL